MDQTRPASIDCNNNNSNSDNNNNISNINNKIGDGNNENQKEEVIGLQSAGTKVKQGENIEESTWRGPEGEAGSRAWVVQVFIINTIFVQVFFINSDKPCCSGFHYLVTLQELFL